MLLKYRPMSMRTTSQARGRNDHNKRVYPTSICLPFSYAFYMNNEARGINWSSRVSRAAYDKSHSEAPGPSIQSVDSYSAAQHDGCFPAELEADETWPENARIRQLEILHQLWTNFGTPRHHCKKLWPSNQFFIAISFQFFTMWPCIVTSDCSWSSARDENSETND